MARGKRQGRPPHDDILAQGRTMIILPYGVSER
jgi:hypothetical protein